MQYVLGNMLNGGGINPDGLSLDLQFAADKTLTARRGPTPVFTRGSGATQINAQGLIEWAPENLVASSENMSAFTRSEVVAPVSVSGGPTGSFSELAVTAINGFHFYRLFFNETTNTTAMMWVLAKRGTARYLRMGDGPASSFDWDTLTWSDTSPLHQTISPVAHPFGDGWYWLPIFRVSGSSLFDLTPSSTSGTTFSFNQSSVETVMVAAVQLSRSNLPQTGAINYYKTTGTSFYTPRFDHDPVTLACKGLLIEEGRTNLLARSQEFNLSPWGTNNAMTVTPDATIAPDGTLTADAINFDTNSTSRIIYLAGSAVVHTFSVWLRADTNRTCIIATAAAGVAQIETICNVTTTWQRFSVVATNWPSGTGSFNVRIGNNTSGTAGTIFAWGAQVEAGSFATSYIPTTTGTLARGADVCNITGGNFNNFYNQSEGTMLVNSSCFAPQPLALPSRRVVTASDGTSGNRVAIGNIAAGFVDAGLSQVFIVATGGSIQATLGISGLTLSSINKTVGAYKQNDFAVSTNGSAVVTDATGLVGTSLNRLDIGNQLSGDFLCGHIAAIRYYKKRLPDAKLVTLTT
jgi:hypothetical protein